MKIENQEYYHVQKICSYPLLWKPGNQISFMPGLIKEEFKSCYDAIKSYGESTTQRSHGNESAIEWDSVRDKIECYIEEEIFEEVRLTQFPHLPSRLCSFHPCTEEGAWYYWKWYSGNKRCDNVKIFKVSLTGVIHETYSAHRMQKIRPFDEIKKSAFKYWSGEKPQRFREHEDIAYDIRLIGTDLLFNGTVTVLENVSPDSLNKPDKDLRKRKT
jgi:hypothetical protein